MLKTCTRCGETKELELFSKASSCKDGHRNYCKTCHNKYKRDWYKDNQSQHYQKCRLWVQNNPDKVDKYKSAYRDKSTSKAKAKQYREYNREKLTQNKLQWSISNRGKSNAIKKRYKLAKQNRTPKWLTIDDLWLIEEVYDIAAKRSRMTGIQWHVDHIYPLQGRTVSGLHVPDNLQVITAKENFKKGNRYYDKAT